MFERAHSSGLKVSNKYTSLSVVDHEPSVLVKKPAAPSERRTIITLILLSNEDEKRRIHVFQPLRLETLSDSNNLLV